MTKVENARLAAAIKIACDLLQTQKENLSITIKSHSRNTYIGIYSTNNKTIFAKFFLNDDPEAVRMEALSYQILGDICNKQDKFRFPMLLSTDLENKILFLEFINHKSFADFFVNGHCLTDIFKWMGVTLFRYHDATFQKFGHSILYDDFTANNILSDPFFTDIVVIDPPKNLKAGSIEEDIGIALFEIIRLVISRRPRLIYKTYMFRYIFLKNYFSKKESQSHNFLNLNHIHKKEYLHLFRVICRYLRFYKYDDPRKQFLRAAYLIPILSFIGLFCLPLLHIIEKKSLKNYDQIEKEP